MTLYGPAQGTFGDWLRQRRRALDLTREQLARQIGCSTVMLRKLESEERRPSKPMVARLAEVLKVAPADREAFERFARGDPFADESATFGAPAPRQPSHPAATPAPHHNLPLQLTHFIGRDTDLAQLRQQLSVARLVTLTGAGGAGKTRLALQAAAGLTDDYADGVWLVDLSQLTDPTLVPQAVGAVLGLHEAPSRSMPAPLLEYLLARQVLLVLDSCEHLVAACAALADILLGGCLRLTILATGRAPLEIPGEVNLVVQPLSVPDEHAPQAVEALAQYEAVQLFTDRAALALPGFRLTEANAAGVARVCFQLDGLPLAIELAAARVRLLTVDQIADRLSDRFQLLGSRGHRAAPRQQTLAATLDWSYELLSEPERTLLGRLAVFRGGWTLEAAERLAAGGQPPRPGEAIDVLTALVNKSMVVVEHQPGAEPRYRLLETIRQYAWLKLVDGGEADAIQHQHADYFLELAEANRTQRAQAFFDWSVRLDREHDNLRAALAWGQTSPAGAGVLLRLAGELWSYWQHHGYWSEARAWQTAALVKPGLNGPEFDPARGRVLAGLGIMLELQGEYAAGRAHLENSLSLFQAVPDPWWQANVLHWMGWGYREQANVALALQNLTSSLELFRQLNDRLWMGRVLNTLGSVAIMQEDGDRAAAWLDEGLALNEAAQDRGNIGWSLNYLGHLSQLERDLALGKQRHTSALAVFSELGLSFGVACAQHGLGETALAQNSAAQAAQHLTQAFQLFLGLGDRSGLAWCIGGMAAVAALEGRPRQAAQLWGAAEALRRSIGARSAPATRAVHDRLMADTHSQLGEAAYRTAWAAGQVLSPEQAMALIELDRGKSA